MMKTVQRLIQSLEKVSTWPAKSPKTWRLLGKASNSMGYNFGVQL